MKFYINNVYCPDAVSTDLFSDLFDYRWCHYRSMEYLIGENYVAWNHITYRLVHVKGDSCYFIIVDE